MQHFGKEYGPIEFAGVCARSGRSLALKHVLDRKKEKNHQQKLIEIHMMCICENMHAEASADVLVHLSVELSVDLRKKLLNVYIDIHFRCILLTFRKCLVSSHE